MRVELRPTLASDLPQIIHVPLPHRIRAVTAVLDGRVLGIGGIGYRPDGTVIAFAAFSEEFRKYPAAIHRAGMMGMKMIRGAAVPVVVAEAQEDNPAAERWLLRFGFEPTELCGRKAFVWRRRPDVE